MLFQAIVILGLFLTVATLSVPGVSAGTILFEENCDQPMVGWSNHVELKLLKVNTGVGP